MEKRIIGRGLLAGVIAGVLAFVYARVFVEPVIDRAIAYEEGISAVLEGGDGHDHGEGFTRAVQANVGMGFGVLAFSVAVAAIFAVAFCVTYGRLGNLTARSHAALLAGAGFVSAYLVPFIKYPPNPPAVSLDETIRERTGYFLLMLVLSMALAVGAVELGRRLAPKLGTWSASLVGFAGYIVAVAIVMAILPTIDETPDPLLNDVGAIIFPGFAADDLYEFRLHALGTQVVIWATIGLVFASMVGRLLDEGLRQPRAASISG